MLRVTDLRNATAMRRAVRQARSSLTDPPLTVHHGGNPARHSGGSCCKGETAEWGGDGLDAVPWPRTGSMRPATFSFTLRLSSFKTGAISFAKACTEMPRPRRGWV